MDNKDIAILKDRRNLWVKSLSNNDDEHSIFNQLASLTLNINYYRVINEARRFAPTTDDGRVMLNGMLCQLLDTTFMESTLMRIRKLIDSSPLQSESDKESRDVYSLVSILTDMKKYSH